jgi:hypothetical protein
LAKTFLGVFCHQGMKTFLKSALNNGSFITLIGIFDEKIWNLFSGFFFFSGGLNCNFRNEQTPLKIKKIEFDIFIVEFPPGSKSGENDFPYWAPIISVADQDYFCPDPDLNIICWTIV